MLDVEEDGRIVPIMRRPTLYSLRPLRPLRYCVKILMRYYWTSCKRPFGQCNTVYYIYPFSPHGPLHTPTYNPILRLPECTVCLRNYLFARLEYDSALAH